MSADIILKRLESISGIETFFKIIMQHVKYIFIPDIIETVIYKLKLYSNSFQMDCNIG